MNFKMLQFEKILKRNKLAKSLENTRKVTVKEIIFSKVTKIT